MNLEDKKQQIDDYFDTITSEELYEISVQDNSFIETPLLNQQNDSDEKDKRDTRGDS